MQQWQTKGTSIRSQRNSLTQVMLCQCIATVPGPPDSSSAEVLVDAIADWNASHTVSSFMLVRLERVSQPNIHPHHTKCTTTTACPSIPGSWIFRQKGAPGERMRMAPEGEIVCFMSSSSLILGDLCYGWCDAQHPHVTSSPLALQPWKQRQVWRMKLFPLHIFALFTAAGCRMSFVNGGIDFEVLVSVIRGWLQIQTRVLWKCIPHCKCSICFLLVSVAAHTTNIDLFPNPKKSKLICFSFSTNTALPPSTLALN